MDDPFYFRTNANAVDDKGMHRGPGKWLNLIHAANKIRNGTFDTPKLTTFNGWYCEEYPDARVVFYTTVTEEPDEVAICSTTEHGKDVLTAALAAMEAGN